MWSLPKRLAGAVADATVGTAIVFVHVLLAERQREGKKGVRAINEAPRRPALRS